MRTFVSQLLVGLVTLFVVAVPASAQYYLNVSCSGFDNYVGKNIYFRVTKVTLEIANVKYSVASAAVTYKLFCLEDTSTYTVDIFVDANDNGKYDGMATDPSWRKVVVNFPSMDQDVDLPFSTTMDKILYPLPIPYSHLENTYSGLWHNNTFSTTGTASANFARDTPSSTINGSITVRNGAFGQPNPITFDGSGPYDATQRKGTLNLIDPFEGAITLDYGKLSGTIVYASAGVTMVVNGTYGEDQIMYTYNLTGAVTANGYLLLHATSATDVAEHNTTSAFNNTVAPFPAYTHASVQVDPALGAVERVHGIGMDGRMISLPWTVSANSVDVTLNALAVGVYTLYVEQEHGTITAPMMVAR